MKHHIQADEPVTLMFLVIRTSEISKLKMPEGIGYYQAWETGPFQRMLDSQTCRGWGAMVAAAVHRLAKKLMPELVSPIIRPPGVDA